MVFRDVLNGACVVSYIRKTKRKNTLFHVSYRYPKWIYGACFVTHSIPDGSASGYHSAIPTEFRFLHRLSNVCAKTRVPEERKNLSPWWNHGEIVSYGSSIVSLFRKPDVGQATCLPKKIYIRKLVACVTTIFVLQALCSYFATRT